MLEDHYKHVSCKSYVDLLRCSWHLSFMTCLNHLVYTTRDASLFYWLVENYVHKHHRTEEPNLNLDSFLGIFYTMNKLESRENPYDPWIWFLIIYNDSYLDLCLFDFSTMGLNCFWSCNYYFKVQYVFPTLSKKPLMYYVIKRLMG